MIIYMSSMIIAEFLISGRRNIATMLAEWTSSNKWKLRYLNCVSRKGIWSNTREWGRFVHIQVNEVVPRNAPESHAEKQILMSDFNYTETCMKMTLAFKQFQCNLNYSTKLDLKKVMFYFQVEEHSVHIVYILCSHFAMYAKWSSA